MKYKVKISNFVFGVPTQFIRYYNPEQFEIIGATQRGCHDGFPDTVIYDSYREYTQEGTMTGSSGKKTNENANLVGKPTKGNYFMNNCGKCVYSAYQRIFIKKQIVNNYFLNFS